MSASTSGFTATFTDMQNETQKTCSTLSFISSWGKPMLRFKDQRHISFSKGQEITQEMQKKMKSKSCIFKMTAVSLNT